MLRVEPWQGFVRVEWGGPEKTTVRLKLHAEEWIGQAGEIIVVDTSVDECSRETNLLLVNSPTIATERTGVIGNSSRHLPAECSSPR